MGESRISSRSLVTKAVAPRDLYAGDQCGWGAVAAGDDDGDGVRAEPGGADGVCVVGAGERWDQRERRAAVGVHDDRHGRIPAVPAGGAARELTEQLVSLGQKWQIRAQPNKMCDFYPIVGRFQLHFCRPYAIGAAQRGEQRRRWRHAGGEHDRVGLTLGW